MNVGWEIIFSKLQLLDEGVPANNSKPTGDDLKGAQNFALELKNALNESRVVAEHQKDQKEAIKQQVLEELAKMEPLMMYNWLLAIYADQIEDSQVYLPQKQSEKTEEEMIDGLQRLSKNPDLEFSELSITKVSGSDETIFNGENVVWEQVAIPTIVEDVKNPIPQKGTNSADTVRSEQLSQQVFPEAVKDSSFGSLESDKRVNLGEHTLTQDRESSDDDFWQDSLLQVVSGAVKLTTETFEKAPSVNEYLLEQAGINTENDGEILSGFEISKLVYERPDTVSAVLGNEARTIYADFARLRQLSNEDSPISFAQNMVSHSQKNDPPDDMDKVEKDAIVEKVELDLHETSDQKIRVTKPLDTPVSETTEVKDWTTPEKRRIRPGENNKAELPKLKESFSEVFSVQEKVDGTLDGIAAKEIKAVEIREFADFVVEEVFVKDLQEQSIKISLHPRELGEVRVAISIKADVVELKFDTENPLTQQLIKEQAPQLKRAFESQGLQLGDFSLATNLFNHQKNNHSQIELASEFSKLLTFNKHETVVRDKLSPDSTKRKTSEKEGIVDYLV